MTIAQTERPSYRSKKRYAKFGKLEANKELKMHRVNRPRNKYRHKKVNLQQDLETERDEAIESNSLIRINNLKQNLKKKSEIKKKLAIDDAAHAPIQIRRSKQKIDSKKGGELGLKERRLREMKKVKNNEVRELLRAQPEPALELEAPADREAEERPVEAPTETEDQSERQTQMEERTTVIMLNNKNEFEIQKLTEDEIKETHLFQSTNKDEEAAREEPESQATPINLNLDIEDSQIGHSLKQAKKSDYGSNLKARVDNFQPPQTDLEIKLDYK